MRILHLSAASEQSGAGIAALLTHRALVKNGYESKILFLRSEINEHGVYSYHRISKFHSIRRFIYTWLDRLYLLPFLHRTSSLFSPGLIGLPIQNEILFKWADLIHLHWINHGFINISDISKWNKPLVWTLRDMWPFTGGCHYSFDCLNYENKCGECPALGSKKKSDISSYILEFKKKKLSSISDIHWIAISKWMKTKAENSVILRGNYISIIPSGIDGNKFHFIEKTLAQKKLNLKNGIKYLLIGAGNFREKQKGISFLLNLFKTPRQDIQLLTFGSKSFYTDEIPIKHHHYGYVDSDFLVNLYAASDLFVAPSIAEAMGKTFAEAQCSGLPVLCFDDTGPADIIKHGLTGYLAKYADGNDLSNGLDFCLSHNWNRKFISEYALNEFDIQNTTKKYITLYEKIYLDRTHCRP